MTAMAPNHVPSAGREVGRREPRREGAGRGAVAEWAAFLPRFIARTLLMTVGAMLFWAVLPALFGWHATTDAVAILSACDVCYVPYWFDEAFRPGVELSFPNKVSLYLAAGRPILYHGPEQATPKPAET